MTETDLQLGGGYTYQWECAILLALNYFFEPVRYNPTLFGLVNDFLGQVAEIHLEGEDRESGVDLEDINLVNPDGDRRILIQVKTKQAEGERWTPTDPLLLKALCRFYESGFFAEQPEDTRFVFLTNRPFNPALVQVKSAIREGTIDQCAEADKLCQYLAHYAQKEKGTSIDADRFRQMLARTALVEYLAVDEVKANVQAKLQAHGRRDWEQAHAVLFEQFARQSTRVGGGTVSRASLVQVLGPPPEPPGPEADILGAFLDQAVADYERRMVQAILPHFRGRSASPDHPYKFLHAFGIEDAGIFFGRDAASDALYQTLTQDRLTVLHARSGAGKTSLLNAGLAPRLVRDGRLPVYARTYRDPVRAVQRAIAPPSRGPWPALLPQLSLHEFLGLVCSRLSRQVQELVVILDQFEEFFLFLPERDARQPFVDALGDCYEDESLPVRFVISMRGDYLTDLADFKGRLKNIFHNEYRLEPMNRVEAAAAIKEPLRLLSPPYAYEPALLEFLLDDLTREELEPPHLQIVCTRLYEALAPGERTISETHYQDLGRVEGVLGNYLRREIEKLGQDGALARMILAELVTSENTRRALPADELRERLFHRPDLSRLESVLTALVAARLLRREEVEGVARYELVHEYLIDQIRAWVTAEDVAAKRARETLRRALANWHVHGWPMDQATLMFVHEQRELLSNLSAEETELLFRSAVAHRFAIDTWAPAAHRQGVDIWPILQPALDAPDHRVRASVVAALWVVGEAVLPALGKGLKDKAPLVRVRAIEALERLPASAARQVLEDNLVHERYVPPDGSGTGFGFYIDRHPVTNAAYEAFLHDNPDYGPPPHWRGRSAPPDPEDHPVVGVSWEDARAYAEWAGKRLPTADEWQRAAGGEQGLRYPWGDRFLSDRCNTRESGEGGTTPVNKYSPEGDSPYRVADMAGNVWEWLADEAGPEGEYRQLRGGAWFYSAEFARTDYDRFWRKPDHRQDVIGFRLCFGALQKERE